MPLGSMPLTSMKWRALVLVMKEVSGGNVVKPRSDLDDRVEQLVDRNSGMAEEKQEYDLRDITNVLITFGKARGPVSTKLAKKQLTMLL